MICLPDKHCVITNKMCKTKKRSKGAKKKLIETTPQLVLDGAICRNTLAHEYQLKDRGSLFILVNRFLVPQNVFI